MSRLFVAVSAHGYGHLAQIAPVINGLRRDLPGLQVVIQGDLPTEFIRSRIDGPFELLAEACDVGMVMENPLTADWQASHEAYRLFHQDSAERLKRQRALLESAAPDLLLADVPWLPLVAAKDLGIPTVGLCSLTWFDILHEGPVASTPLEDCLQDIQRAYQQADLFLRPAPSMPMAWLPNSHPIGPLAIRGKPHREEIIARLGLPSESRIGLLQFGGVSGAVAADALPLLEGVVWLVPEIIGAERCDFFTVPEGIAFIDLMASCDLMITKPGYNSFTEAAANGLPLLSAARNEWPESRWLVEWVAERIPFRQLTQAEWRPEPLKSAIESMLEAPRPEPTPTTGVEDALALLRPWFS